MSDDIYKLKFDGYGKPEWEIGDFVHASYNDYECGFDYCGRITKEKEHYGKIIPIVEDFEGDEEDISSDYYGLTFISEEEMLSKTQKFLGDRFYIEMVKK